MERHSIYDAKAKLSAIIRAVKNRRRVCITERGRDVAWIIPVPKGSPQEIDDRLDRFEEAGLIVGGQEAPHAIKPITSRPGALGRFLEDRDH